MFSVVIPVHNKLPHLDRSINSVLNQTFQNFELILIDDASTDGSSEKLKEFTDPRIKIYKRDIPGPGGYAARNLGIEKASNEWISFLDADDEWYPHHLERMKELSINYPKQYFMACGWQIQKRGRRMEDQFYQEFKSNNTINISVMDYLKFCLAGKRPVWTSIACIKKSSPVANNLFPAGLGAKRGGDLHAG